MKEFIKTLLTTPTERLKNPFIGTFIFTLIALNWRPILYLSSSESTILERINHIDKSFVSIYNQLWLPLILALFYILALPYLTLLFETVTRKAVINRKENQLSLKISDLKSNQKIAEQESILANIKANYRDKADLNKQIEDLNKTLDTKNETIIKLESKIVDLNEDLNNISALANTEYNESERIANGILFSQEFEEFKTEDLYPFFEEIGTEISTNNSFPSQLKSIVKEKYKYSGIVEEVIDPEREQVNILFTDKGKHFWKEYLKGINLTRAQNIIDNPPPF